MTDLLTVFSFFPHLYKLAKVWICQYNKISYFGYSNASGRIRFTSHHDPNDSVSSDIIQQYIIEIKK